MNKLYVHIGMGKTGTSAIQFFVSENSKKLDELGFLYPEFDNNENLLEKNLDYTAGNGQLIISSIENKDYIKLFNFIDENIENKNIIFSSENLLFYFAKDSNLLQKLIEKYDVIIVLYIRKQDEFYNSLVNQWTKAKELLNNDCMASVHENYFLINKIINSVNGKIIFRAYEKEQLKNENVVEDFLYAIGIDIDNSDVKNIFNFDKTNSDNKIIRNESLTSLGFFIKREYNKFVSEKGLNSNTINKVKKLEFVKKVIEYTKSDRVKESDVVNIKKFYAISKEERLGAMSVYSAYNSMIALRFFNRENGILFFEEIEKNEENPDIYFDSLNYDYNVLLDFCKFIDNDFMEENVSINQQKSIIEIVHLVFGKYC